MHARIRQVLLTFAVTLWVGGPIARAQERAGAGSQAESEGPRFNVDLLSDRPLAFGEIDSVWVSGGISVADNLRDAVDSYAWTTISWFGVRDVEMAIELGLWNHNQPGPNSRSLSVSNLIRWHFVNTGDWTLYADVGFGLMASSNTVPDGGTGLNFLPRVGVGLTRRLTERSRLQLGLRWHHISNARIGGDLRNPSRDSAMLYAGVIFPF